MFDFLTELITEGKLAAIKRFSADILSVSSSSELWQMANAQNVSTQNYPFMVANLPLVLNSVEQSNIYFCSPLIQHHSFFRN